MSILDKLLKMHFLSSGEDCPPFMQRWTLVPAWIARPLGFGAGIFVHRLLRSDDDMHDHPSLIITIGIKGRYIDVTPNGEHEYSAPWIRKIPANYVHRVKLVTKEVWTIALQFDVVREWGFHTPTGWVPWRKFQEKKRCDPTARV